LVMAKILGNNQVTTEFKYNNRLLGPVNLSIKL
jgi:hypothetical protein